MLRLHPAHGLLVLSLIALAACGSDAEPSDPSNPSAAQRSSDPSTSTAARAANNASDAEAVAAATAGDALLMEEVEVPDPARGNMTAYRLLVPDGWELEGGVIAVGPAFHMLPTLSDVTVRAPDGRGVRFWSSLEYGYADGVPAQFGQPYDGRPFAPIPRTLGEHWERMVARFPAEGVTDFEVVDEELLPDATEQVREQLAPLYAATQQENAQLRGTGRTKEFDVEARLLTIRYRQDGRAIEATIFATLRESVYRYPNGAISAAMWHLDHMYAVMGPVGTDATVDPVLAAIVRSRREDPDWQTAIQRWYLERNRQLVAEANANIAAAARSAATARASQSQDVLDISFQGWKDRNALNDAGHSSSILGIHERTTYVAPGGTTVDLPSHYRNVYTDGQGHFVLHDDANWQINTDPAWNDRNWQRIEAQR